MKASGGGGARLQAVSRQLHVKWEETKRDWRDRKALEFEERYLAELFDSVERTCHVIEELEKTLKKIQKDCE